MGLFEELRDKNSQAADYTVKVTNDVTNQAKVRVDLHTQKTLLARCYENIGRACYDKVQNGAENDTVLADYISEASRLEAEVCALREKLAALQGNVLCPVCGKEVNDTFPFCPHCGAKMPEKPVEPEADIEIEEEVEETEETVETDDANKAPANDGNENKDSEN